MKKTVLLLTASVISAFSAFAQDSAATEEKSAPLEISGSVDAYFRTNLTAPRVNPVLVPDSAVAPGSSFANKDGFALGMANLVIAKEGEKAGFVADLVFGPRGADAVFNSTGSASIVNQLYAYLNVGDKVTLTLGNFNTFLGYEVISPAVNFNYSTSYMFSYGPFSHTGLKADFALTDELSAMLAVMNPTDYTEMNNFGSYSLGAQLGYSNDNGGAWLNVLYGDQDGVPDTLATGAYDSSDKGIFQIDLTTGWNLTDDFYLGVNATSFSSPTNDTAAATKATNTFAGGALYLQYAFSDAFALGLRTEHFLESEGGVGAIGGYDTDGSASITDITLSANIKQGGLTIIPEVRVDMASEDIFKDTDYKATSTLASFVLAAVYAF